MYTIKEAAARSGVGASAIRAWERRYGVVRPVRTPAGYRLYDDDALRVLLAMRTLIETGWAASEAARAITAGEVDPGVLIQAGPALSSPDQRPAATPPDHRIALIARFLAAAEAN